MTIKFTWDVAKASINHKKHGITFDEAKTVFYDSNARLIHDPDHSHNEERFIIMGLSTMLHILTVCHCYKDNENTIRIISARKATKSEQKYYWESLS